MAFGLAVLTGVIMRGELPYIVGVMLLIIFWMIKDRKSLSWDRKSVIHGILLAVVGFLAFRWLSAQ